MFGELPKVAANNGGWTDVVGSADGWRWPLELVGRVSPKDTCSDRLIARAHQKVGGACTRVAGGD